MNNYKITVSIIMIKQPSLYLCTIWAESNKTQKEKGSSAMDFKSYLSVQPDERKYVFGFQYEAQKAPQKRRKVLF